MVLDQIDTGDWTKISGVDFGTNGLKTISAEIAATSGEGQIEVYLDAPTAAKNRIATTSANHLKPTRSFPCPNI